jgi:hypothetical protein
MKHIKYPEEVRADHIERKLRTVKTRNQEIAQLYEDGIPISTLAETYGLSYQWVWEIVHNPKMLVRPTCKKYIRVWGKRIYLLKRG